MRGKGGLYLYIANLIEVENVMIRTPVSITNNLRLGTQ